jgi:hypothetical protein
MAWLHCIQNQRVENRSVTVVMYVRWRCQLTIRLYGSDSRCVTISFIILNRAIWRYRIIDCVVKSHLKYLMGFEKMLNLSLIIL